MNKVNKLRLFAWGLSSGVVVVAVIAWGQNINWSLAGAGTYKLFPLFGLLAFSLMWSHYVVSAVRQYFSLEKTELKKYIEFTSAVVLLALALHPGLLVWQLWRDGFGLPPGSYLEEYVAPTLKWAALIGTVSLIVFFAYELRRLYAEKSWWKYVVYLTDAAMAAIILHSLNLGSTLNSGWLRTIWYFYALSFGVSLGYAYYLRYKQTAKN